MRKIPIAIAALFLVAACARKEQAVPPVTSDPVPGKPAAAAAPATPGTAVGQIMVPYTATFLDGSPFDLAENHGRVVLLNLWATWCGPCRYEIPELQDLHNTYNARGFDVIGVSVDEGAVEGVKEFVAERKMTYPVVLDPEGKLANLLESSVLPTTILIDRAGRIVWKKYGAISGSDPELLKAIAAAL